MFSNYFFQCSTVYWYEFIHSFVLHCVIHLSYCSLLFQLCVFGFRIADCSTAAHCWSLARSIVDAFNASISVCVSLSIFFCFVSFNFMIITFELFFYTIFSIWANVRRHPTGIQWTTKTTMTTSHHHRSMQNRKTTNRQKRLIFHFYSSNNVRLGYVFSRSVQRDATRRFECKCAFSNVSAERFHIITTTVHTPVHP